MRTLIFGRMVVQKETINERKSYIFVEWSFANEINEMSFANEMVVCK